MATEEKYPFQSLPKSTYKKKHRYRQLDSLQKKLRVKFSNKSLLNRALIHRSYVNETNATVRDNERLEFLGDAVLALVVNEYLFRKFEDYSEGDLAKIKSAVVSESTLAKVAMQLNLGSYILMGKGEEHSGGRFRESILANTMEAVIGAMYLDAGLKATRKCVLSLLKKDIERIDKLSYLRDPKTTLQEIVQKKYKCQPVYEVVEEKGPDHLKEFTVRLIINGKEVSRGTGNSKRKAEVEAARIVLEKLYSGSENGDMFI
ncbi:MAG: ribonuclease III [Spirochaetes bacterium]|nr:ribonuclease III [Spirochaetota bacterium]